MNNPIFIFKKSKHALEVEICGAPGWEGFDELIQFIIREYDAVVLEEIDGVDARRWILEKDGNKFELQHDDMFGNYLIAPQTDSVPIVRHIAENLAERLKKIKE